MSSLNQEPSAESGELEKAIRTLLPHLRNANYVDRWSSGSPAVQALSILAEHVGEGPVQAGETMDPHVPTVHHTCPVGLVDLKLDGGRNALLCAICRNIIGYLPTRPTTPGQISTRGLDTSQPRPTTPGVTDSTENTGTVTP